MPSENRSIGTGAIGGSNERGAGGASSGVSGQHIVATPRVDRRADNNERDAERKVQRFGLPDFLSGRFVDIERAGTTEEVDCEDGALECANRASTSRMQFVQDSVNEFSLTAAGNNPCFAGSPDIDYRGTFIVDRTRRELAFSVLIDRFPAFEGYVIADGRGTTTLFTTGPLGSSPSELFGGPTARVSGRVPL